MKRKEKYQDWSVESHVAEGIVNNSPAAIFQEFKKKYHARIVSLLPQ